MNAKLYANLTRQFLRFLEELTPEEITALDSRATKLEIRLSGPQRKEAKSAPILTDEAITKLAAELRAVNTSERAFELLKGFNKQELTRITRVLDLPVEKSDTVEQMRERVVQSTVGFRLRSRAIQG